MYKYLIRPVLFLINAETIHALVYQMLFYCQKLRWFMKAISGIFSIEDKILERSVMGLNFKNPVGIAAGFDKDAGIIDGLAGMGFGFVEIGTITPEPQPGNPRPRLFRLKKDKALINRMGFNNAGVDHAVKNLSRRTSRVIVGGNIGKNKNTPNESAHMDYVRGLNALYDHVDYFVINISSPNTPGLRELQEKVPLKNLLTAIQHENEQKKGKPVLLKISPDLTWEQIDDIIGIVRETKLAGIVATNTTISRNHLQTGVRAVEAMGEGGLSGKPLFTRSLEIVKYLRNNLGPGYVIIGAGGIMSSGDAKKMMDSGANLIQVYTGFIYQGPLFARSINSGIALSLKKTSS
ncbi:MAG TPA: quinone-dependent dihydroorotate dehydrogenase [Cyclobacteriaceae bacterium]|nr:quinone-dependent dihydroorotate dehydrogenase [Cyclobacteriaceae bacterium]